MPGPQLRKLCKPPPEKMIGTLPGGQSRPEVSYLAHYNAAQLLLFHLDRPYSWQIVETGTTGGGAFVVGRLGVTIDDEPVSVDGIGIDDDLKQAESDAFKRAAMKVGVGLSLWAKGGEDYWLNKQWEEV